MDDGLQGFSDQTRTWFHAAYGPPTPTQTQAWPAIRSGQDVLVISPTGSGKTLAAFLWAIDTLLTADRKGGGGVRVLYISPMKALGTDVARNLEGPLEGIRQACRSQGVDPAPIRVGMRTGDTDARGRRALASHPPDILVTTPESLYLMLTSKVRRTLKTVETVIVDEIHVLAGDKRGAHLAISLERLDALAGRHIQRIGLSATVRPRQEVARFLGGGRPVTIIEPGTAPAMELKVVAPLADMTDLAASSGGGGEDDPDRQRAAGSIWPAVERAILDQVLAHRTTLVFVNSRGLAEKLTARLNDLYAHDLAGKSGKARNRPPAALHYDSTAGSTSERVGGGPEGRVIAMAHHGSVSKERRRQVESDLKAGRLRCVVATSSLELGIDMGSVDLVIQVAPPLSTASGLQRVGRADHQVGSVSHARIYPLNRRQILQSTASVEGMLEGDLEPTVMPDSPLDILAQQTVAAAAMDDLNEDTWFDLVRRAAPFAHLDRDIYRSVIGMLSGLYTSQDFSAFRPILVWDREGGTISARPGAQRLAVTSGGTIPDRGAYSVVLSQEEDGSKARRVGELDEEMVYESRVGDVITLGTTSWRIQQITRDRVVVLPAPGRSARLPFWHGDGAGRDAGFGRRLGALTRALSGSLTGTLPAVQAGLPKAEEGVRMGRREGAVHREGEVDGFGSRREGATSSSQGPHFHAKEAARLQADGLDGPAIDNLAAFLAEQKASTGLVADDRTLVVERCRNEEGDWRLILHSPYGRRVHEPWAMAISSRLQARRGYDGSVYATDEGIVVQIPDTDGYLSDREVFLFEPDEARRAVIGHLTASPLFAARFRQCAARSLYMPRTQPGRRVPLWQQRLRASQLQDAALKERNFPLVLETMRECLQDVYDMPALEGLMRDLGEGGIALVSVTTESPSPMAGDLLFGYVGTFMYQYDMPQAERDSALLSIDPAVLAKMIGQVDMASLLDGGIIDQVEARLQHLTVDRRVKGAEGVADLLRILGPLSPQEIAPRLRSGSDPSAPAGIDEVNAILAGLQDAGRVRPVTVAGQVRWIWRGQADRLAAVLGRQALGGGGDSAGPADRGPARAGAAGEGRELADLIGQYAATHGPFTTEEVAGRFGLGPAALLGELDRLQSEGKLFRGNFPLPAHDGDGTRTVGSAWLDAGVFRLIRSRSLAAARKAAKPVGSAAYTRFLCARQGLGAAGGQGRQGQEGLLDVIGQLEGLSLPAPMWESSVFPARVPDYGPHLLDALLASGQVIWLAGGGGEPPLGGIAFFLSDDLDAVTPDAVTPHAGPPAMAGDASGESDGRQDLETLVGRVLSGGGAYRFRQLAAAVRAGLTDQAPLDETALAAALWRMVASRLVTSDSFTPVRSLVASQEGRHDRRPHLPRRLHGRTGPSLRRPRFPVSGPLAAAEQGLWLLVGPLEGPVTSNLPQGREGSLAVPPDQGNQPGHGGAWQDEAGRGTILRVRQVEGMMDRYGLAAPGLAGLEGVEGGFSALYPVCQQMEDAGRALRGVFVDGMGGAQFAPGETVEDLRAYADKGRRDQEKADEGLQAGTLVLDACDPANLYGAVFPWPDLAAATEGADKGPATVRPQRKVGNLVVLVEGRPAIYAAVRGRHLLVFEGLDGREVAAAFTELSSWLHRQGPSLALFRDVNGLPLVRYNPYLAAMREAGFTPTPQGIRLY